MIKRKYVKILCLLKLFIIVNLFCLKDKLNCIKDFSNIIRGLINYYNFVKIVLVNLWKVVVLYWNSCTLTFTDKHKLKTATKVFKNNGPYLKIKRLLFN